MTYCGKPTPSINCILFAKKTYDTIVHYQSSVFLGSNNDTQCALSILEWIIPNRKNVVVTYDTGPQDLQRQKIK